MTNNIVDLLRGLGFLTIGSFSIVTLVGYLAKSLYEKFLQNDLELHKQRLQVETEKIKMQLDKQKLRSMVMFSKLYEERALLIKDIYDKIITIKILFHKILSEINSYETEKDNIKSAIETLKIIVDKQKIFLNRTIVRDAMELIKLFEQVLIVIEEERSYSLNVEQSLISSIILDKQPENQQDFEVPKGEMVLKVESILSNLESEFQNSIGINEL